MTTTRILFLAVVLLAACGGDPRPTGADGGGGTAGGSTGTASEIDRFIDAYCTMVRACCGKAGHPPDALSDCETKIEGQIALVGAVRAGKTILVQPEFDECIATLEAGAGICAFPSQRQGLSCSEVFQGTAQEGEPCDDVIECQRGAHPVLCLTVGEPTTPQASGTCRTLAEAGPGEPCGLDIDEWMYGMTYEAPPPGPELAYCGLRGGLYCDLSERTCQPLAAEGEACDNDCAVDLYCDRDDATCKPSLAEGTACESHGQCATGLRCIDGQCAAPGFEEAKVCTGDFN